jgi:hypothetical protein
MPKCGMYQKFLTGDVVPDGERKFSLLALFNLHKGADSSKSCGFYRSELEKPVGVRVILPFGAIYN